MKRYLLQCVVRCGFWLLVGLCLLAHAHGQVIGLQPTPMAGYTWDTGTNVWDKVTTTDTANPFANTPQAFVWTRWNPSLGQWVPCQTGENCLGGGVTEILPGANITCSPEIAGNCVGAVTINAQNSLTLEHNGSATGISQTVVNNTDNGTIAPDSGYTLGKFLTNSGGGWAVEYLAGQQFQVQLPSSFPAGQAVIVYPTGVTYSAGTGCSGGATSTAVATNTSAYLTNGCNGAPPQANWTFANALPSYINPSNVTAIYAFSDNGRYQNAGSFSAVTCTIFGNTQNVSIIGVNNEWPIQPFGVQFVGATGSQVDSATCTASLNRTLGIYTPSDILNIPAIGLYVYYTGPPPPANTALTLEPPLFLNPATELMGVGPINLASGADGGVTGLLPLGNLGGAVNGDCIVGAGGAWTAATCPGGGSGTVTSFSAGNLSPLFTTSVATATTTPALSFTLDTQAANTVFAGPSSGSAAAPTFRSLIAGDIPSSLNATSIAGITIPSGDSLTNTGVTNGCAQWASGVLGSTGTACGSGSGGITALTQDVTASGSGSVAATVVGLETLPLPTLAASTGFLYDNNGVLQLTQGYQNAVTETTNYTASTSMQWIRMNCSSACTVTLPASIQTGYTVVVQNIGTAAVTIASGGPTYTGVTSLADGYAATINTDGTNYLSGPVTSFGNGLTFSPSLTGNTVGINFGSVNTWTATQTFSNIIDSAITAGTSPICPNGTGGAFTTTGCTGGGGGSTAWSSLTNPTGNLALTMGSDTSTFTYGATTGSSDLFSLTDTASNTGTGIMLHPHSQSGSTEIPFQADANGKGFYLNPLNGAWTATGFGSVAGSVTLPAGTAVSGLAGAAIYTSDTTNGYAEVNENNTGNARICTAANAVCGGSGGSGLFAPLITIPTTTSTGFTTAINQSGTFSASNISTGISLADSVAQTGTNVLEGIGGPYPSVAFTATFLVAMPSAGISTTAYFGIWATSGTTSTAGAEVFLLGNVSGAQGLHGYYYPTLTGSPTSLFTQNVSTPYLWLKWHDDATNLTVSSSYDGVNYYTIYGPIAKSSTGLGSGGYQHLGIFLTPFSAATGSTLLSYTETTP